MKNDIYEATVHICKMIKFIDNNAISLLIKQSAFFLNKRFHFYINFDLNLIKYKIT